FGAQCIVVAIDAKRKTPDSGLRTPDPAWEVYIHGGRTPTGLDAVEWARRGGGPGAGEELVTPRGRGGARAGGGTERKRGRARGGEERGDCLGRGGHTAAHLRRTHRRRRRRGVSRVDFPLPRVHDP